MNKHSFRSFIIRTGGIAVSISTLMVSNSLFANDTPSNIDELGFNAVMDRSLFGADSEVSIQSQSSFSFSKNTPNVITTNLEGELVETDDISYIDPLSDNLDSLTSSYQTQGLKIKRLSSSWQTDSGTLTVGSDWANFQDILKEDKGIRSIGRSQDRTVANQIKWLSPNGFSIAVESSPQTSLSEVGDSSAYLAGGSPSIVLSWQGGPGGAAGQYRVSAMGTKLDAQNSGQSFSGEELVGWGLNLEGGWQIGDLFAALSVTYGKGINSYILQRFGDEILVTPNSTDDGYGNGHSIRPSLYYTLNDKSSFHVALGHYSAEDSNNLTGIDTLDTIQMGYNWSPWPSTRFGLELMGQNSEGPSGEKEDTQLTFGAKKLF